MSNSVPVADLKHLAEFTKLFGKTPAILDKNLHVIWYSNKESTWDTYAVRPKRRLFILDLDSHKINTVDFKKQVAFFEKFFDLDFEKTYTVQTPSGGLHVYLMLPERTYKTLEEKGFVQQSLRGKEKILLSVFSKKIQKDFSGLKIDADLRTAGSYVVGEGSYYEPDEKLRLADFLSNGQKGSYSPLKLIRSYYVKSSDSSDSIRIISDTALNNLERFLEKSSSTSDDFIKLISVKSEESGRRKTPNAKSLLKIKKDSYSNEESNDHNDSSGRINDLNKDASRIQDSLLSDDLSSITDDNVSLTFNRLKSDSLTSEKNFGKLFKKNYRRIIKHFSTPGVLDMDAPFHKRRAYVFWSLRCCYTLDQIAYFIHDLGLDQDSYKGSRIAKKELFRDLGRMNKTWEKADAKGAVFHGSFCNPSKGYSLEKDEQLSHEEIGKLLYEKKSKKGFSKNREYRAEAGYIVPDRILIAKKLSEYGRKSSQAYKDAFAILDGFMMHVLNSGGDRFLAPRSQVKEHLGLTDSRSDKALRLLRKSGVIQIKDRQKQHYTTTYILDKGFVHSGLTKELRILRKNSVLDKESGFRSNFIYDWGMNSFVGVHTGEVHYRPVEPENDFIASPVDPKAAALSLENAKKYNIREKNIREVIEEVGLDPNKPDSSGIIYSIEERQKMLGEGPEPDFKYLDDHMKYKDKDLLLSHVQLKNPYIESLDNFGPAGFSPEEYLWSNDDYSRFIEAEIEEYLWEETCKRYLEEERLEQENKKRMKLLKSSRLKKLNKSYEFRPKSRSLKPIYDDLENIDCAY